MSRRSGRSKKQSIKAQQLCKIPRGSSPSRIITSGSFIASRFRVCSMPLFYEAADVPFNARWVTVAVFHNIWR